MLRRNIEPETKAALADTPVVLLHGARQTGKSTLARAASRGPRRYLTLDDATVLAGALADPTGFLHGLEGPVVLDEVQRAPGLFTAIKAAVDRDRTPGRFLLTGSANILLVPKLSESLAGRIQIITLWPFSQGEIEGRADRFIDAVFASRLPAFRAPAAKTTLIERIHRGGYPEPLARPTESRRSAWFASYLTTILQRDIRDMANVEGLTELPRLLALIASRASGLLNFADLGRGLSMPQTTLKRYFALLEATFLVVAIPAWSNNRGLRLTKSPKIMLADTGLASHLLGLNSSRLKVDGRAWGSLLENFAAMELTKQMGWSRTKTSLYHFRTLAGREVDLVLEDTAGRVVGIEVKASGTVSDHDFGGLRALADAAGDKFVRGIVLYDGAEAAAFGPHFSALPIASLWSGTR